ncbi:tRNA lysidine(34) synthetase TilS [Phenylobacterium deserti]|uniref:tRNA(Ile)-lysidine synthase n=1 Tax=Phenylobacterium deserti TaxID=1914756 RepID=A0A328AUC7_9CAUL|nr:tRNA lysidine(34) synthetase TilS [Phenylobacterium deserti]
MGGVLDRRLDADSRRPLAVAFSGGGDSLALLLAAHAWTQAADRRLLVLTVDHRLRPESAAWTKSCEAAAQRLGAAFRALPWLDPKPATGLPAAAREARHRLLADAAREAGAAVILMGHTADDRLEAEAMRAQGSTTPDPREWSPSPVWPQGRGLFVLRPMLDLRRSALRTWLQERGESWIDDPANQDLRFARSRARLAVHDEDVAPAPQAADLPLASEVREAWPGVLALPREALRSARPDQGRRLLALMAVCAGGGARTPASASIERAHRAFCSQAEATLALAGARLEADAAEIRALREAGESARGGLAPVRPEPGEITVWDGRFEVEALRPGLEVRALSGRIASLPPDQREALYRLPIHARPALPAVIDTQGKIGCALLEGAKLTVRSLVLARFRAAAGLVDREPL